MKSKLVAVATVACSLLAAAGIGQIAYADATSRAQGRQRALERDARDRSENRIKDISFKNVIDLSHVVDTNIPLWPGDPEVKLETVANIDPDGYYLRSFTIGEHSATHMNAGNSFFAGGSSIDSYGPEKLVRRAVVIDVRQRVNAFGPDYALTIDDVKAWERRNGRVPKDSIVLVYTGWQAKWGNPAAFIGNTAAPGDTPDLHFPGIAGETTEWMLSERGIVGVGIDTHGADPGQDVNYRTNNAVLAEDGIVLECLTNLDRLKPTGNTLVLGRLALKDGSGSPLTVLAFAE